jgi:hypothetical protein
MHVYDDGNWSKMKDLVYESSFTMKTINKDSMLNVFGNNSEMIY